MKTKFTQIIRKCAVVAFACFAGVAHAATFTAVSSGSWSNTATWAGGLAPGSTINGIDNVVINSGVTVNMDMDVTINSLISYIQVNGTLNSTSSAHVLDINTGDLKGNGTLNLHNLRIGTLGAMTFSGTANIDNMWNNTLSLSLANQLTINDTLFLESGNLTLGSGGYLTLAASSVIKVDNGSMGLGTGVVNNSNNYSVVYVGSSKNMGFELSGTGLTDIWINLDNNTQSLSVVGGVTLNGNLHHQTGRLNINGSNFTLNGDYISSAGAMIEGSATSNLMIVHNGSLSSNLVFSGSADELNNLWIDTDGGNATLASDLTINGTLTLEDGDFVVASGNTLTMDNGSEIQVGDGHLVAATSGFNGTAGYSVMYYGSNSTTTGPELSGSGMNNLTINLQDQPDSVEIMNNITINGTLDMQKGNLDMNGYNVVLNGSLTTTAFSRFNGDANSSLTIATTSAIGDTIWFNTLNNTIASLTINTDNGSYITLGNHLYVNDLNLTNGGVIITDNDLWINSTGTITGADEDNYVMINGSGHLVMHVNVSSPYVMFPVGTNTSYSPAGIQQNSGTATSYMVNVRNGVWSAGLSGTNNATTESVVNRTWDVAPSGTGSFDANLRLQWDASMEVNGFDRNQAYITHYSSSVWDVQASGSATSISGGMYQMERMNITSFSPFAVVDEAASVTVAEIGQSQVVQMYPNPVQDVLTCILNIDETTTVDLVDLTGKVLYAEKLAGKSSLTHHSIDFSALPNGIYFVRYTNSTGTSSYKIVKS